jgi:Ribonuclease G/E
MDERRNRQKVMQGLEEALRGDRAPSKVLQFNDFGLVAITRKRVKQSLERTIGTPCPYCSATGCVKSVNTVCNEIYVEMRKLSKHLEHPDVMLRVNPEVAEALQTNSGRALYELEE